MFEFIKNLFGYKTMYQDHRGVFSRRYDSLDAHAGRPIHENMSVAYPGAKTITVRKKFKCN